MAKKDAEKSKGMTVFRSDRHEDVAAILTSALVVIAVLVYMAFLVNSIKFKAPSDGTILSINVTENAKVKKGDVLVAMEVKEKKAVHGTIEEKTVQKDIKSKLNGTVVKVEKAVGDKVKKDKDVIMVFKPDKGSLP